MRDRTRNSRLLLVILLALFVLAGAARLNPFCLLEPDIPDYLFTAHSLASFEGYREIDIPGEPLHAFRPPGLALLLVPFSWISPYNVQLAKSMVPASALLAFALIWCYSRELCGSRARLLALLLIAASPYSLLFASEVMSEFPYLACMFATLLLLRRESQREGWRGVAVVTLLLAFLPFLRTIGVVWIAAIGLWGLSSRPRLKWSLAALLALAPTLLWSLRNAAAGGPTYLAAIARDISGSTLSELLLGVGSGAWYYLRAFIDLLLPAIEPGRPLYERVLITPAPDLGGPFGLAALLGPAFALLFLLGLYARRKEEGGLIALQSLLLFAALAIYPPRHERLVWPLLPLAWIYALLGARLAGDWLAERLPRALAPMKALALVAALAVVMWQGVACIRMVATNLSWVRLGDRFYSELAPPMYYADWQAAGRWVAASSPPEARILTRHSDVGFTSGRYQESLRFEELSPAVWRRRISPFHARYLVVPTTLCGWLFPRHLLDSDPVYRYEKVYEARDVAVFEVLPNRTGLVVLEPRVAADLERCIDLSSRHPERIDLIRRAAELLSRAGRQGEAEGTLRSAISAGLSDAGLHFSLGRILERQERHREALETFNDAMTMPKADLLKKRIGRGVERAQAALASREAGGRGVRALMESAHWRMNRLEYARAREDVDRLLELAPGQPAVAALHGDLLRAAGLRDEAKAAFRSAASGGDPRAAAKLRTMELEKEIPDEAKILLLAEGLAREGLPGRALAYLEEAGELYPGSRQIGLRLADLYLFYGLVHKSEALYRNLLQSDPRDEAAGRGLQQSLQAAELPFILGLKRMSSKNRSFYAAWIALLVVILLTAGLRARLLDLPLERDEGEYAYAGQLMLEGVPPYEQAYNMKMPGIYAAYALVLALFGQTHTAIHLGLLLVNAGTILLLFLLVRRLWGPVAAVAAAAAFALLSAGAKVQGLFANAEHFVILPALGGILLLLRALDSNRRATLFFAALLLGLAPIMKQHGAAFVLFGGLFLIYRELLCKPFSRSRVTSRILLYTIGTATPFALTCLVLWWSGVFDTFWFWTFDYAREYVASISLGQGLGLLGDRVVTIPGSALALWLLSAAGLLSLFWNRSAARQAPFALGFLFFSFAATCPGFYFRPHYFVLLLPAVALFAGIGADSLHSALSRVRPLPVRAGAALLIGMLIVAHVLYQQWDYFFRLSPTEVARRVYGTNPFPESLEVAEFIRQNSAPDDRVAILGSEPQICFYAGRRSATGYIYTYGLMEAHPYARRMQQEMIAEIEAAKPKFLVFVRVPASWLARRGSDMTIFAWLEQYEQKHYQLVGVADIGWPRETRYYWGAEAARYIPQSKHGVLVFVRRM